MGKIFIRRSRFYGLISVAVFFFLYLYTAVCVLSVLIVAAFNMKKSIRGIMRIWARGIFLMLGKRLRISGIEHVEKGKNYILLANHASLFDIMAILSFYPGVSWFGREHLLRIPIFGRVLKLTHYVPMKSGDLRNTKEMLSHLLEKSGSQTIAIFPEGTRTTDGSINRFRKGFVHVLKATEMSVLPVTLNGFFLLKPKNRFSINFESKVDVVIHKPIEWKELAGEEDHEILNRVRVVIESAYIQTDNNSSQV
jgi:1-acyl-sn-glycerol-3-phosphate acyltransferase